MKPISTVLNTSPLMKWLDKHRAWGIDEEWLNGGDFFKARR